MKAINWKSEFVKHDLFGGFGESERDRLLDPSVSKELKYEPGETILREGEIGNSLFLIGSGEVEVCIIKDDHRIPVATLTEREIFGEMALFESKPRAATVIAQKESVLLEIDGRVFVEILRDHPAVEFKIMSKLSERLRRVMEEVLAVKFNDLHQRFDLLNKKVDNELDLVRNSITTAETMLTVTNRRAEEISERAKEVVETTARNHDRIFQAIKILGGVTLVGGLLLAYFGYSEVKDIEAKKAEVEKILLKVEAANATAEKDAQEIREYAESAKTKLAIIEMAVEAGKAKMTLYNEVFEPKFYKLFIVKRALWEEVGLGKMDEARETIRAILSLKNPEVSEDLFREIVYRIMNKDYRTIMNGLLYRNLDYMFQFAPRDRFLLYYILLSGYVLDDEMDRYKEVRAQFDNYADLYIGKSVKDTFNSQILDKFAPTIFQALFRGALEKNALEEFWKNHPDANDDDKDLLNIFENKEFEKRASKRTESIRDVWNRIP